MLHGGASALESLPKVMAAYSVTRKCYNQVSLFGMVCKKKQLLISSKTIHAHIPSMTSFHPI